MGRWSIELTGEGFLMQAIFLRLAAVLVLCSAAFAERVEDPQHLFSVEIPDGWKYEAPRLSSGDSGSYYNPDRSIIIGLKSYDIGSWTLEQWTHHVTSQMVSPEMAPKVFKEKLNKVESRRLDWGVMNDRFLLSWMAKRGDRGAGITLSYPTKTKVSVKEVRGLLTSSFRWIK
jgi:hypothetical protein